MIAQLHGSLSLSLQLKIKNLLKTEVSVCQQECGAYVSIELADEAREVVMLEVVGQEISGELGRTPDDECGVVLAP